MRLQMCVKLIVFLHAGFPGRFCFDTRAEFLKMHAYAVERYIASAVWTVDSYHLSRMHSVRPHLEINGNRRHHEAAKLLKRKAGDRDRTGDVQLGCAGIKTGML